MLSLSKARKIVDQAIRRARELGINISVAVCDNTGRLIALNQMDQSRSWESDRCSMGKAVAAAVSGLPSVQFIEQVHRHGLRSTSYNNVVLPRGQRGGLPVVQSGVVQGGCGVSGAATAEQDEECARAGIAAIDEKVTETPLAPLQNDVLIERRGVPMTFKNGIGTSVDPPSSGIEDWAAEQSARAAQRLSVLGEMTGGIAHDFRNILAVIDSCLRLAERNMSVPDKLRASIGGAQEGVDRGLRLISQLLTFASQRELPTSAADVNGLLSNSELFPKYAAGSSVRIDFQFSANLPKCLVDPSQFAAAILNLVINAREAMPNGGVIQITTASRNVDTCDGGVAGDSIRVRVKDNGLGMTDDVMKKIFEPFFTTKNKKGSDLGIPQVCAFIRQIGGRLNVDSQIGYGTTFDLFLPAVEAKKNVAQLEVG